MFQAEKEQKEKEEFDFPELGFFIFLKLVLASKRASQYTLPASYNYICPSDNVHINPSHLTLGTNDTRYRCNVIHCTDDLACFNV